MLDAGPLRLQPVDDRLELRIVEQHPVLGVIDDVEQLVIEQARVDRVEHAADPYSSIPGDEMPAVIERERADTVALANAEVAQCLRHFQRIAPDAGPICPHLAAIGIAGDNFAAAVLLRRVIDQGGDPQFPVLHRAEHSQSPSGLVRRPAADDPPRAWS